MKELLSQYASYSLWAHKRLLDFICELDQAKHHQEVPSSFPSLYKTIYHVWTAEDIWWQRVNHETKKISDDPFSGSMRNLASAVEEIDQNWMNWLAKKDENMLHENLSYSNSRGEGFHQPIHLLLMQVFNHNTYHNGQIVTMLRQLNVENIPGTDFILWTRFQSN